MAASNRWYKENPNDKIWWLDNSDEIEGVFIFSFDKKTQYNLFADHDKLTPAQKELFYKENPFWREFFEGK